MHSSVDYYSKDQLVSSEIKIIDGNVMKRGRKPDLMEGGITYITNYDWQQIAPVQLGIRPFEAEDWLSTFLVPEFAVAYEKKEKIDGRDAFIIDVKRKEEPVYYARMWIDSERGLPLLIEHYGENPSEQSKVVISKIESIKHYQLPNGGWFPVLGTRSVIYPNSNPRIRSENIVVDINSITIQRKEIPASLFTLTFPEGARVTNAITGIVKGPGGNSGLTLKPQSLTFSKERLLNFLIEQNEAAREKIKTAEFKVKWTATNKTTEGLRHDKGFGDVKIKGNWRLSTKEYGASIPATGWTQKQTASMVINDKYLAYWPSIGNSYIYQDDHQSLKELSDDAKLRRDLHTTPDFFIINVAFGGERETTFKEMMKLHQGKINWTAQESKAPNGDTVYMIKRYSSSMIDTTKPDAIWTIDPQKGFLVTQAEFYSKSGNIWVTRKIEPKQISDGIWLPISYQEQRYGEPTAPQPSKELDSSTTVQLENISINKEIPDNYFVLESILPEKYRESTVLFHKKLDGNTEAYIYRNGEYVLRKDSQNSGSILKPQALKAPDTKNTTSQKKTEPNWPSAKELLRKYAETQDKFQSSFISKEENSTQMEAFLKERPEYKKGQIYKSNHNYEFRTDGKKYSTFTKYWGDNAGLAPTPENRPTIRYTLWDGEASYQYSAPSINYPDKKDKLVLAKKETFSGTRNKRAGSRDRCREDERFFLWR